MLSRIPASCGPTHRLGSRTTRPPHAGMPSTLSLLSPASVAGGALPRGSFELSPYRHGATLLRYCVVSVTLVRTTSLPVQTVFRVGVAVCVAMRASRSNPMNEQENFASSSSRHFLVVHSHPLVLLFVGALFCQHRDAWAGGMRSCAHANPVLARLCPSKKIVYGIAGARVRSTIFARPYRPPHANPTRV